MDPRCRSSLTPRCSSNTMMVSSGSAWKAPHDKRASGPFDRYRFPRGFTPSGWSGTESPSSSAAGAGCPSDDRAVSSSRLSLSPLRITSRSSLQWPCWRVTGSEWIMFCLQRLSPRPTSSAAEDEMSPLTIIHQGQSQPGNWPFLLDHKQMSQWHRRRSSSNYTLGITWNLPVAPRAFEWWAVKLFASHLTVKIVSAALSVANAAVRRGKVG